jgi:hypothetical protein
MCWTLDPCSFDHKSQLSGQIGGTVIINSFAQRTELFTSAYYNNTKYKTVQCSRNYYKVSVYMVLRGVNARWIDSDIRVTLSHHQGSEKSQCSIASALTGKHRNVLPGKHTCQQQDTQANTHERINSNSHACSQMWSPECYLIDEKAWEARRNLFWTLKHNCCTNYAASDIMLVEECFLW